MELHGWVKKAVDTFMDGEYHIVYRNDGSSHVKQLRPTYSEWSANPLLYTENETSCVYMEVYDRFAY